MARPDRVCQPTSNTTLAAPPRSLYHPPERQPYPLPPGGNGGGATTSSRERLASPGRLLYHPAGPVCRAGTSNPFQRWRFAVDDIRQRFLGELAAASSPETVEQLRVRYLGRKGILTELRKGTDMGSMTPEQRREFGSRFNALERDGGDGAGRCPGSPQGRTGGRPTEPRPHPAGGRAPHRLPPPHHPGPDGAGGHLPGHGLPGADRLRRRDRVLQLRRPQHPRPTTRPARCRTPTG